MWTWRTLYADPPKTVHVSRPGEGGSLMHAMVLCHVFVDNHSTFQFQVTISDLIGGIFS